MEFQKSAVSQSINIIKIIEVNDKIDSQVNLMLSDFGFNDSHIFLLKISLLIMFAFIVFGKINKF